MLTINSHGVAISIAGCIREMVRGPTPMPQGCPYTGVPLSTLTLLDSYPRLTRLMRKSALLSHPL